MMTKQEELHLRAIGVLARIRHGQLAGLGVLQMEVLVCALGR